MRGEPERAAGGRVGQAGAGQRGVEPVGDEVAGDHVVLGAGPALEQQRWFIRHRDHPQIKAFVKGATAAAAGAIAGAVVVLSRQTITDIPTAAIAAVSLGLLMWRKIPEPVFVALGAIAGILLH